MITAFAARIGSPCDPVLASLDAKGDPHGEDDDKLGRDARIERRIDSKEGLLVSVRDYYGRGGSRFTYRIEVEPVVRGVSVAVDLGHRTIPRSGALIAPRLDRADGVRRPGDDPRGGIAGRGEFDSDHDRGGRIARHCSPFRPPPRPRSSAFSPRLTVRDVPASFRVRERGPLDEVPREGDQQKGPRETVIDAIEPLLAVADRASIGISTPSGPIEVAKGGRVEVAFAIERRGGAVGKKIKVRLVAAGKSLERFETVPVLDLAADASSAAFALKPKSATAPGPIELAAHAWLDGSAELLGVDSSPVVVVVK